MSFLKTVPQLLIDSVHKESTLKEPFSCNQLYVYVFLYIFREFFVRNYFDQIKFLNNKLPGGGGAITYLSGH